MVARTTREILRWLENLHLTYPILVPKWDLLNGYAYAEILHAYFPNEIHMFTFTNGRALNSRLLNWSLIKRFISKKNLPISTEFIDATLHGKDSGAEELLKQTYEVLTNKKSFEDPLYDHNNLFTDYAYQQTLDYFQRAHTSQSIKNNLKISELLTDPSYAYQIKRNRSVINQLKLDREKSRIDSPERFDVKPTLAERCARKALPSKTSSQDWSTNSCESRAQSAVSTNKSATTTKRHSRQSSAHTYKTQYYDKESNDDNVLYKELILKQHSIQLKEF